MESTLEFLKNKYNLDFNQRMPIEIPRVSREILTQWLHELDFKTGVEVGVAAAAYSELIAKNNPQMKVYGVDPWKVYKGYKDYVRRPTIDALKVEAKERMKGYSNYEFIEEFSMDAVKRFEDNSLDFVYIDANHNFQGITNDIIEWEKKVRPGGIISGHDFFKHRVSVTDCHVYQVVNGYTDALRISPWFVLGASNVYDLPRDKPRSFMWIKKAKPESDKLSDAELKAHRWKK